MNKERDFLYYLFAICVVNGAIDMRELLSQEEQDEQSERNQAMLEQYKMTFDKLSDEEKSKVVKNVEEILGSLYPWEEMLLKLAYGLEDGKCYSYEEIGIKFDITRERVRQIEGKVIYKIKNDNELIRTEKRSINKAITRYLNNSSARSYDKIMKSIDRISWADSALSKVDFYASVLKYSHNKELLDKVVDLISKMNDIDKLKAYLHLYYAIDDISYLDVIEKIAYSLMDKHFCFEVVEALTILDMDKGGYKEYAINYLTKHKEKLSEDFDFISACHMFYTYLFEDTGVSEYLDEAMIYREVDYDNNYSKCYQDFRFHKYARLTEFEKYFVLNNDIGYHDVEMFLNDIWNNTSDINYFNAIGACRYSIVPSIKYLKTEYDYVYYSICILIGLEMLNKYKKYEDREEIGFVADDIFMDHYLLKANEGNKLYNLNKKIDEAFRLCLTNYNYLPEKLMNIIVNCDNIKVNDLIILLNDIYKDFSDDEKYRDSVEMYKYGFNILFRELFKTAIRVLWETKNYDEYLKLLLFIEKSKDIITEEKYEYGQFISSIYYSVACYYLKSGEERFDLLEGSNWFIKFVNTYNGDYKELDKENTNLLEILNEHGEIKEIS